MTECRQRSSDLCRRGEPHCGQGRALTSIGPPQLERLMPVSIELVGTNQPSLQAAAHALDSLPLALNATVVTVLLAATRKAVWLP